MKKNIGLFIMAIVMCLGCVGVSWSEESPPPSEDPINITNIVNRIDNGKIDYTTYNSFSDSFSYDKLQNMAYVLPDASDDKNNLRAKYMGLAEGIYSLGFGTEYTLDVYEFAPAYSTNLMATFTQKFGFDPQSAWNNFGYASVSSAAIENAQGVLASALAQKNAAIASIETSASYLNNQSQIASITQRISENREIINQPLTVSELVGRAMTSLQTGMSGPFSPILQGIEQKKYEASVDMMEWITNHLPEESNKADKKTATSACNRAFQQYYSDTVFSKDGAVGAYVDEIYSQMVKEDPSWESKSDQEVIDYINYNYVFMMDYEKGVCAVYLSDDALATIVGIRKNCGVSEDIARQYFAYNYRYDSATGECILISEAFEGAFIASTGSGAGAGENFMYASYDAGDNDGWNWTASQEECYNLATTDFTGFVRMIDAATQTAGNTDDSIYVAGVYKNDYCPFFSQGELDSDYISGQIFFWEAPVAGTP